MKTEKDLKKIVKDKYSSIANQEKEVNAASCCGATSTSNKVYSIMMDDYSEIEGYNPDADLGLGCGLPTEFAMINKGDTVIDLGSGAGNDCFVARHETGDSGKIIGIDFTESMINKARMNAEKLGYNNVEFRFGDIDNMPVSDNLADVVISNCVLNLVPNKQKVINEIYRVLKPGGHFSISDIVLVGDLPQGLKNDAEMYAGCVAGAIQKDDYLKFIQEKGFENIQIQKEKTITLPDDLLSKYLSDQEINNLKDKNFGIFSITVYGDKPGSQVENVAKATVEETGCCKSNESCC